MSTSVAEIQQQYSRYTKTMTFVSRVKSNLMEMHLQYLILTGVVFAIMLFFSPEALLEVACLGIAWVVVVFATRQAGETVKTGAFGIMGLVSCVVLFWVLEDVFWWGFGASFLLVMGHAVYREPKGVDTSQSTAGVEVPPTDAEKAEQTVAEGGVV